MVGGGIPKGQSGFRLRWGVDREGMGQVAMAETSAQGTGTQAGRGCSGKECTCSGGQSRKGASHRFGKGAEAKELASHRQWGVPISFGGEREYKGIIANLDLGLTEAISNPGATAFPAL